MQITILQDTLQAALSTVARAVPARSTLPVLSNVYLKATMDGRLQLSATNLEMGITTWTGAKVTRAGETTIPAKTLAELVATFPRDVITLDLDERTETLSLNCGGSKAKIKGVPGVEFPPMPETEMDGALEFDGATFRDVVRQTVFSASTDEARPVLTGVQIELSGITGTLASADGFRLSTRTVELSKSVNPARFIVPAKALAEVAKVTGGIVQMLYWPGNRQVVFRVGNTEITSQLIDGSFPDFRQVIPAKSETLVTVETAALLKACKQAEIFARESNNIAKFDIQPESVCVSSASEETGQNETIVPAEVSVPGMLIAFNIAFLRQALEVVKTSRVVLGLNNPSSPGVIWEDGNTTFTHVIMPMHI